MGIINDPTTGIELDGTINTSKDGKETLSIHGVSIVKYKPGSKTGFKAGCINLMNIPRPSGSRKSRPDFLLPLAMGVAAYHELCHPIETKEEKSCTK